MGPLILFAAVVFAQAPAEVPRPVAIARTLKVPVIVWTGAAAADWATTYRFSTRYGDLMHEQNPLISGLNQHPAMMISAGSAIDVATAWSTARILRGHPRLAQFAFYGAAAFRGYLAVHNIEMMRRAEDIRRVTAR